MHSRTFTHPKFSFRKSLKHLCSRLLVICADKLFKDVKKEINRQFSKVICITRYSKFQTNFKHLKDTSINFNCAKINTNSKFSISFEHLLTKLTNISERKNNCKPLRF